MRALLAGLLLALVCTPLQAQTEKEPKKVEKKKPPSRHGQQGTAERVPGSPPPNHKSHTVSKDSQPPKGQPSPAVQFQQEDVQRQQKAADDRRTVRCTAAPACGGGYGRCQPVEQTYTAASLSSSRRDIVRRCVQANTPDSCKCAPQCERVARCNSY